MVVRRLGDQSIPRSKFKVRRHNVFIMNGDIHFREATRNDLSVIVKLLADDPLGKERERGSLPLASSYELAFDVIDRDPNNELVVATCEDVVVGVLQLTYIPYLTYGGSSRALIEGVRIDRNFRSRGIGRMFMAWAIERSRLRGCHLIQLTSDKRRPEAIRFYKKLGFTSSHEGLKLRLLSHAPFQHHHHQNNEDS